MKRTIALVGTPAIAGLVLLGGSPAQAAEKPHHDQHATKAEKRHDRRVEARKERRADRAAQKPAQDTTTAPPAAGASGSVTAGGTSASKSLGKATKTRGVVSCAVTADRAGSSFTVHNGCDTTETLTVSVQAQPGPWHVGLCQAGGCHLISRYDVQIPPGTHTLTVATGGACWVQVDVKWHDRLIRSNHYVKDCKPTPPVTPTPTPKPPVQHNPGTPVTHRHSSHVEGHLTQPGTLPRTGGIPWGEALLGAGFIGGGWTLRRLTRQPAQQAEAWTEATR